MIFNIYFAKMLQFILPKCCNLFAVLSFCHFYARLFTKIIISYSIQ